MTDLTLIMPDYSHMQAAQQPLGLYFIKAYLESRGYSIKIIDLNRDLLGPIGSEEHVGVYVSTGLFKEASVIIQELQELNKTVIAGGPHTFSDPYSLLDLGVDYVIQGDGELSMERILEAHDRGQRLPGQVLQEYVHNLDILPLPDFVPYGKNSGVPISTSRGCPYGCIFCTKCMGPTWRAMSSSRVGDWLDRHDGQDILVLDDNFTHNARRLKEVAEHVRSQQLALSFSFGNGLKVNTIKGDTLRTLKRMNTVSLAYGVESIHDHILRLAKKGQDFEMIQAVVDSTRREGLNFHLFMIIGLPGDTYIKTMESLTWVLNQKLQAYWNIAMPYPTTELSTWVSNNARWIIDPHDYTQYGGHFTNVVIPYDTPDYPAAERLQAFNECSETTPRYGEKRHWLKQLLIDMGAKELRDYLVERPQRGLLGRILFGRAWT